MQLRRLAEAGDALFIIEEQKQSVAMGCRMAASSATRIRTQLMSLPMSDIPTSATQ